MRMTLRGLLLMAVLLSGAWQAFGFYDPGIQRWPNRDPINELGFKVLTEKRNVFDWDEEKNLYCFVRNQPTDRNDPIGLRMGGEPGPGDAYKRCCEAKGGKWQTPSARFFDGNTRACTKDCISNPEFFIGPIIAQIIKGGKAGGWAAGLIIAACGAYCETASCWNN